MTLVQALAALAAQIAALTERINDMTTMGMTDAEALAFGELKAQVATMNEKVNGIHAALETVVGTQVTHAETMTAINGRLDILAGDVNALKDGVGDLSGLPALPAV